MLVILGEVRREVVFTVSTMIPAPGEKVTLPQGATPEGHLGDDATVAQVNPVRPA